MKSATKLMSGEKYVTASSVIIIANGLQDVYLQMLQRNLYSEKTLELVERLHEGIVTRLSNLESNTTLLVSTFLDPRFKNVGFTENSSAERAKNLVTDFLCNSIEGKSLIAEKLLTVSTPREENEEFSIFSSFDRKTASFEPSGTSRSRAIIEVQRYLEEPLLNRHENPLNWWKENSYNYPNLSKIVREKFGTVATQERLFSKTGQLLSERRNRLSSDKVKQIMFINGNC